MRLRLGHGPDRQSPSRLNSVRSCKDNFETVSGLCLEAPVMSGEGASNLTHPTENVYTWALKGFQHACFRAYVCTIPILATFRVRSLFAFAAGRTYVCTYVRTYVRAYVCAYVRMSARMSLKCVQVLFHVCLHYFCIFVYALQRRRNFEQSPLQCASAGKAIFTGICRSLLVNWRPPSTKAETCVHPAHDTPQPRCLKEPPLDKTATVRCYCYFFFHRGGEGGA